MKRFFKKKAAALTVAFSMILSGAAATVPAVPVLADSTKVVTLGADLSESQRNSILRYFGADPNKVQIIYVNNQDERNRLGSYVPLEQIGTRTISCAYVQPTASGGIQVKTANLNWVTSHMIAASLSTSGVKNCNVIAAAPFEVSGTGALTGVLMAYEQASGQVLSEEKKDVATKEMVTTGQVAQAVGQIEATQIVNDIKISVIQEQVDNTDEARIEQIVNDAVNNALASQGEQTVSLSEDDRQALNDLAASIAEQKYDYEEMHETLDRIDQNVQDIENQMNGVETTDAAQGEAVELEPDNILINTDDAALGEDVIMDATIEEVLPENQPKIYDQPEEEVSEDPFEITTTDSSVTGDDTYTEPTDQTDVTEEGAPEDAAVDDAGTEEPLPETGFDETGDDTAGTDEADIPSGPSIAWAASGQDALFDSYSLRFYLSGHELPESGTVTFINNDTMETAAVIDLSDRNAWGTLTADGSDAASENGWSEATAIYVLTGNAGFTGSSYQITVDLVMPNGSTVQDTRDVPFKAAGMRLDGSGSLAFMAGSSTTLTVSLPEGAASSQITSSDESIISVAEPDLIPEEGAGEGQTTLSFLSSGTVEVKAAYFDANGDSVGSETLTIAVF